MKSTLIITIILASLCLQSLCELCIKPEMKEDNQYGLDKCFQKCQRSSCVKYYAGQKGNKSQTHACCKMAEMKLECLNENCQNINNEECKTKCGNYGGYIEILQTCFYECKQKPQNP